MDSDEVGINVKLTRIVIGGERQRSGMLGERAIVEACWAENREEPAPRIATRAFEWNQRCGVSVDFLDSER